MSTTTEHTTTEHLVRAQSPRTASGPALRYLQGDGSWGRYDTAITYHGKRAADYVASLRGQDNGLSVTTVEQHPVDLDGFPMVVDEYIGAVRLTHCCAAATSVSDGPLYCKSCYEEVSWEYDGPARTPEHPVRDQNAIGPIVLLLPPLGDA